MAEYFALTRVRPTAGKVRPRGAVHCVSCGSKVDHRGGPMAAICVRCVDTVTVLAALLA